MSIRRQLAVWIGLLMLLIMSGNMLINILQLKSHFEGQLSARADETATTLALSMTQGAGLEDDALLRSMIDVVFDRGHYAQIRFDYVDSKRFVIRTAQPNLAADVPNWFQNWMSLDDGLARAHVSQGWHQLGYLTVKVHPGVMYLQLWRLVKAEIAWFSLMAFIAIYGARLLLNWQLLPLKQVSSLATKLALNQFTHIVQQPKARELKRLVNDMNRLSDRLQASFFAHGETVNQLQKENFFDDLTGLNNQKGWSQFIHSHMAKDEFIPGWVLMLQVSNLLELNQTFSKNKVDELLQQIATQFKTEPLLNHEHAYLARKLAGEYWIFRPDVLDDQYAQRINMIQQHIMRLSLVQQLGANVYVVALPVQEIIAPSSLAHQLDLLVTRAKTQHKPLLIGEIEQLPESSWQHWSLKLNQALNLDDLILYAQPLFDRQGQKIQQEVHCRLIQDSKSPMLASFFWPMVEKLNLASTFDRLIVEKWIKHFESQLNPQDWVLNLSGNSLNDGEFCQWLEQCLSNKQKSALVIELSEYTLAHSSEAAQSWLQHITVQGVRLSIDHIGTSGKSFGFLARFPLYQAKIERRFIRDIDHHQENRFFVAGMIQIFHAQKILCFAEGVETPAEKATLIELGIDGVMGYGLSEPYPL